MHIRLVTNHDDWEGLYVNGKLVTQGHEVTRREMMHLLNLDYQELEVDAEFLAEELELPDNLKDCKLEPRSQRKR